MNKRRNTNILELVSAMAITLAVVLTVHFPAVQAAVMTNARTLRIAPLTTAEPKSIEQQTTGIALRLGKRVEKRFGVRPPLASLRAAVQKRQTLLATSVDVRMPVGKSAKEKDLVWTVTPAEHMEWIRFSASESSADFSLDREIIADQLVTSLPLGLPAARDARLGTQKKDAYGVTRAEVIGRPQEGYEFTVEDPASRLEAALRLGTPTIVLPLRYRTGTVSASINGSDVVYERLSNGKSDFETSPWGRRANIKKGIEQHLDGVVIPKDTTFSFNATLSGPVTTSRGWFDSLIIVNGSTLEPAPGGGICQVATTAYRAALLAGLPVLKRAPHSLYVHYYKLFGLGLDATIFPGKQDLTFENDTPGDLLVLASLNGTEATVEMYGVPDGRTVAMDGPYFTDNADNSYFGRALRANEIGWVQTITYNDGSVEQIPILSAYGKMPRSLAKEVLANATDDVVTLHASAPLRGDLLE